MEPKGRICVFAKPPKPGVVKTRLIPLVGEEAAATLARAFLLDTCAAVRGLNWAKPVLAVTEAFPSSDVPDRFEGWQQGEGDLGARLERVLRRGLEDSPFAIAVGADSPGLPLEYLEQACATLTFADAVIGPCDDGGFYLLGLRRCPEGLFAGIPWSHRNTFAQTLAKLKAAGLRVSILDAWFDVDRPEDLTRLRRKIACGQIQAPETRRALAQISLSNWASDSLTASIIIPALNERECLPRVLADLHQRGWASEIIVVDGGSTDGTREWLRRQRVARVLDAPSGRGVQLNAGSKVAMGEILLFLHADSLLPPNAYQQIREVLWNRSAVGGCFRVHFAEARPRSLRLVEAGINLRARLTRSATGDQAIFVRKDVFEDVGGYPDWPLFEDVELVRRIKNRGSFRIARSAVIVSPRRYLRLGVWHTVFLIYGLRICFWLGVSPFTLKKWFGEVRPHLMLESDEPFPKSEQRTESHATNLRV